MDEIALLKQKSWCTVHYSFRKEYGEAVLGSIRGEKLARQSTVISKQSASLGMNESEARGAED
jgi:hypothetical protein